MKSKIICIKLVHTVLFLVFSFSVAYILYSGITQTYNWILVFSISAVLLEGLGLLLNKWRCPLTDLAMKYGATEKQARITGLFFPKWLVPHVFKTYGALFVMGIILVVLRHIL